MSGAIEQLEAALDALADEAPADGESLIQLHRLHARFEANLSRTDASFDASAEWSADGAKSAAAWISARCRLPKSVAQRSIRLGRSLRTMPATEQAWLAGDVTGDHVRMLVAASDTDGFAEDEAQLVELARGSRWRRFCQELAYWRQLHDEDREEKRAAKQVKDRSLHLSQSFQGAWFLDGTGDPVSGGIVDETLRLIEDELFENDWQEAKVRLGRDPLLAELSRTKAQRRWDALVEMAVRARTAPRDGRRPAPLFTVLVGYETVAGRVCQLANGTVVTPGSLLPYLDEAHIERVVFGPASRVLDVGVRRRLFTGADRRAVQVRDLGECFHDLCDAVGDHLQIDHIQPSAAGGPTIQENGRAACGTHNRRRHQQRRGGRPSRGP